MDLHDKNQSNQEQNFTEELYEEGTENSPKNKLTEDDLNGDEHDEDFKQDASAVKDEGITEPRKSKNVGVYFALALCLVALGVGAWATYDTVVKVTDVTQNTTSSVAPSRSTAEVNQIVSGIPRENVASESSSYATESIVSSETVSEVAAVSSETETEPPVESTVPEFYHYPVAGQEIMNGFSNGDPVYNMTMDDWRTHDGLDIAAQAGQNVMSIGVGSVIESYEDVMWGNVLIIQHGDMEVRYCGLAEKSIFEVGAVIEDGQILGTVGTVPLEEKENPHIHIQIKKNGVWIDPTRVLLTS